MRQVDIVDFPHNYEQLMSALSRHQIRPTFETLLYTIATIGTVGAFEAIHGKIGGLKSRNVHGWEEYDYDEVIEFCLHYERIDLFVHVIKLLIKTISETKTKFDSFEERLDAIDKKLSKRDINPKYADELDDIFCDIKERQMDLEEMIVGYEDDCKRITERTLKSEKQLYIVQMKYHMNIHDVVEELPFDKIKLN